MASAQTYELPADALVDTHVQSSMAMITEAAELAGSGRAVVLGCGRGAEIPIQSLSERFEQVDFVELDADALRSLVEKCQQLGQTGARRTFYRADLTGLLAQLEPKVEEVLANASQPLTCLRELGRLLSSATPRFWSPPGGEKYNLVICSTVLTMLQAVVRGRVEAAFLARFPDHRQALPHDEEWLASIWDFARRLEDGFIDHLETLLAPGGIAYLSDTVHVCWLARSDQGVFTTQGAWTATRTSQLSDYLRHRDEIMVERGWQWGRQKQEGPYWGRLYGVQAIIYRVRSRT